MTRAVRKWMTPVLAVAALVGLLAVDVGLADAQQFTRFRLSVIDDRGNAVTSGRCRILNAGLQTDATVYTDGTLGTAATNPLTLDTTTGEASWYASASTLTYDAWCWATDGDVKGAGRKIEGVTRQTAARLPLSGSSALKMLVAPINASATLTTQTVTGVTIQGGAVITHAHLETTTAAASATAYCGVTRNLLAACTAKAMSSVGSVDCAPSSYVVLPGGDALVYNNQNHATTGYCTIYYMPGLNNVD